MLLIMTSLWYWTPIIRHKLLNAFKFMKAVSDTVFDMINAVYREPLIFIGAVNKVDSRLPMRCAGLKAEARRKESHFIGSLVGVKLPKAADHWSARNRSAAFCLQRSTKCFIVALGANLNLWTAWWICCLIFTDIQFWRTRKSLEGLSVRSIFFNVFQSLIVVLYVLDNETNTVVVISCVVGLFIEFWKITKVVDITVTIQITLYLWRPIWDQSSFDLSILLTFLTF